MLAAGTMSTVTFIYERYTLRRQKSEVRILPAPPPELTAKKVG